MKIIDDHGNEVDEGCLVEEILEPRVKKPKVTRIPDNTPTIIVGSQKVDGKVLVDRISFRDRVLGELDFPEQAFHEVSKHDLDEFRIADPIAFLIGDRGYDSTHVRIDFYAKNYIVEVTWKFGISRMCLYRSSESSATLTMDYAQEQSLYSGIGMVKQFILSTTNSRYHKDYERYCKAKGIGL